MSIDTVLNKLGQTLPSHVDVLVVGAGISGIGMAYHLKTESPQKSFAIIDARTSIGGTWDLFRYPGIRSDSDLHTYGYEFKPWKSPNAIADAHEILDYLGETVEENGLRPHIHFGYKVERAEWDSDAAAWTVFLRTSDGEAVQITCNVLFSAAGYYDYSAGYTPQFEGSESFRGEIVHPQFWPEDLDYTGKRVVVIGSGATAVTLIPAMAEQAAHVTMLQRSPSYVIPVPKQDPVSNAFKRWLPEKAGYRAARRFNIGRQRFIYRLSRKRPELTRRILRWFNEQALPKGYDVDVHFNPTYNPWDQRLCAVPDNDLFKVISSGKASVVTDHIDRFTETGIRLKSGDELQADIIVTATGLKLLPLGGIKLVVDGEDVVASEKLAYKSMMLSDIPNFAFAVGYTNSSWTLKVDLVCEHLCRMFNLMDREGYSTFVATNDDPTMPTRPLLDFTANYVLRAMDEWPKQGTRGPWTVEMDYRVDRERLRKGPVEDPALHFSRRTVGAEVAAS
ncbi:MAG TPA: NAD(P)/FAD-dependent oxidoreductase [Aeromicrobium sp.]|nr:NAD(P)/FAD-dependent oxidoreductase [Aeromicrobium sp.]HKY58002.1 NAD(P)/FAD-dependent oxidoreductase [Aeromicrobium sp.]